jgi:hypothetical protein
MTTFKRLLLLVPLLLCLLVSSAASANEPWWHLTAQTRPSVIQPGSGQSEVLEVKVSASGGDVLWGFGEFNPGEFAVFPYDATHQEVQSALEGPYGAGSVEVTGGCKEGVPPLAECEYVIKFVGPKAGRGVAAPYSQYFGAAGLLGGEGLQGEATLTELAEGRPDGQIAIVAANLGDASVDGEAAPIAIEAQLPAGLEAVHVVAETAGENQGPVQCKPPEESGSRVSCTYGGTYENEGHEILPATVPTYASIEMFVDVVVKPGAKSEEAVRASVSGGEVPGKTVEHKIGIGDQPPRFGVESYEVAPEEEGGGVDTQAGSHPFQLTTTLTLNQVLAASHEKPLGESMAPQSVALAKDLRFKLPPGLIGNPTPFPQCSLKQFLSAGQYGGLFENQCPAQTAIGMARTTVNEPLTAGMSTESVPLFNLEPSVGEPARFGFIVTGVPVFLDTGVRTGEDYGLTVETSNLIQVVSFIKSEVTFWGVPGDPRHDGQRGWGCVRETREITPHTPCNPLEARTPPPLLELPTSCPVNPTTHLPEPLQTSVEADSWAQRGVFVSAPQTSPLPALDGCNRLPFEPSIEVKPDGQAGSTPTGLAVKVSVPQAVSLNGEGLAEADVKNTTVALPAGVAINPAGGDGLQACDEEGIALHSAEPPTCPEASKIGTVKIKTPLLPNPLEGAAYLAEQNANPFGSLVALYVFVEDPISGSRVKLAGEVVPNPVTGQLVSTFKNTPQLPFETFELHFFGGDRAPLATPARCGAYTTTAAIEPWTETGEVDSSSTFDITSGPASFSEPQGRPCPGVSLPFEPSLTGGATNVNAGAFSPFTLTLTRKDGEQNMQSAEAHLPPGLSGILSNIELCPEPQANLGECPPGSLIGETTVSVGVGGDPFTVGGGRFYLTGPYNGTGGCTAGSPGCAPFGVTFEVPAKAGPFDLKRNTQNPAGEDACDCVIVRGKIEINPTTAAITIISDPPGSPDAIPTSIEGIPLEIQHVNAITTRGNFQFNPTNCNKMEVTGTIHSSEDATDTIGVPFQVTNCAALEFTPKFVVSTSAKPSRANGASLSVKLAYPTAPFGSQANIAKVKVELPKQLPSRLTTLQKACTSAQFHANPAGCPADSIVGHAKAITPLVPVPLEGPAYFVSNGGEAFPNLIVVLQGYNVTIDLVGDTFISKAGVTSSTFKTVPDQPVDSFELTLPQGPYSALAAHGNLCKDKLTMPTEFVAQNGAEIHQTTKIGVTGCVKHKAKKAKHAKRSARHAKRGKPRKR